MGGGGAESFHVVVGQRFGKVVTSITKMPEACVIDDYFDRTGDHVLMIMIEMRRRNVVKSMNGITIIIT